MKKYIFVIIFTAMFFFNYLIIDKTWMHKFKYVKYINISKNLAHTSVEYRENILNLFASTFKRNNTYSDLKLFNLRNGYDLKLTLFSSLNKSEVNKLMEGQINQTILDIKDKALENIKNLKKRRIPLYADDLTFNEIEEQKIVIEILSKNIKTDFENYEVYLKNNTHYNDHNFQKFLRNIKKFVKDLEEIYLLFNDDQSNEILYKNTYQKSREHIKLLKELTICKFNYLNSFEICNLQQKFFNSALDYFYYIYTLKNLINTRNAWFLEPLKNIYDEWENETVIDFDKEEFYEVERIGPSDILIVVIAYLIH